MVTYITSEPSPHVKKNTNKKHAKIVKTVIVPCTILFFTNRRIMMGKFSGRTYVTHISGDVKNMQLISSNSVLSLLQTAPFHAK